MSGGIIVQVIGAVVDVEFARDAMPRVFDALTVDNTDIMLEVQQQLGDGVVRTIALGSTDGLKRGLPVTNTGDAITVPVDAEDRPTIQGLTIRNADDGITAAAKLNLLNIVIRETKDAVDYESGSGGLVRFSTFEDNDDDDEPPSGGGNTRAALEALEAERATLTERIRAMDEAGLELQPDTDPEARVMRHGQVGYNVQSSVDGKHRLIVDADVVQSAADQEQLYRMARRSQRQLKEQRLTVLADSGYSSGRQFRRCQAHGLTPYVPVNRAINNHGDGRLFDKSGFSYHAAGDYYRCPAGERLPRKTKSTKNRLYLYTSEACQGCRLKEQCTSGKQRWVSRHFEEDVLNEVAHRTAANPLMMRRRKAMVEHPFGTLKRRMDGGRFLLRGLQKAKAEIALAVTAYNLTRAINVLGARRLRQALAT